MRRKLTREDKACMLIKGSDGEILWAPFKKLYLEPLNSGTGVSGETTEFAKIEFETPFNLS